MLPVQAAVADSINKLFVSVDSIVVDPVVMSSNHHDGDECQYAEAERSDEGILVVVFRSYPGHAYPT